MERTASEFDFSPCTYENPAHRRKSLLAGGTDGGRAPLMDKLSSGGAAASFATDYQDTDTKAESKAAAPSSAAVQSGPSAPEPADQSSESDQVECWPSRSAVESCSSPVRIGTRETVDPSTGELQETAVVKACGSSSCEACRERKRRRLVAHFTERFWSAKRLRFVTLTLDKAQLSREGIDSEEERKAYLLRVWKAFLSRLRRRCGRVRYYRVTDRDETDGWHIHAVLSAAVPERVVRWQWFAAGGGCVLDAQQLDTPSQVADQEERKVAEGALRKAIGYCVHKPLHVAGATGYASQGDGYSSEKSRRRRRRAVEEQQSDQESSDRESLVTNRETERSEPETGSESAGHGRKCRRVRVEKEVVESTEECRRLLKRALRRRVGTWVRVNGGPAVRLLKVADRLTVVEEGAGRTRTDLSPFDIDAQVPDIQRFIPMQVDRQQQTSELQQSSEEPVLTEERFRRVRNACRTASYVGTDEQGRRCRWTYDQDQQTVEKEVLE